MGEGTTESIGESPADGPVQDWAHDWPQDDWVLRPWLLAGSLGLAGLLIHFVTDGHADSPGRIALAAFLFFGPLAAAFSLERAKWQEALVFAAVAGLVMAGLAWRATAYDNQHYPDQQYGFGAGVITTVISLPLFQAGFHRLRFKTPYRDAHFFAWTDLVSAGGSLAFVGLSWLLIFILSQLFFLLKIELLRDLMNKEWFGWTYSGICFGGALGVLRNHLKILGTLQFVVMLLFSLLAVPLAVALVCFLLAMIVSGPAVLWEATQSATPVLLACAGGAFVLTNAIVRDDDTDMTRSVVMRVTAFVLAVGILPLTVFAAISMGTRIAQHGLSPERLWALCAIAVACAYGVAVWGAAARGRVWGWRPYLRSANLNVAVGIAVLALFLALPILDFGGISAANQVARLESGKVSAKTFDYDALKWDFGDGGRRALAKLTKSQNAEIARLAKEAQRRNERPYYDAYSSDERNFTGRIDVRPAGSKLPEGLRSAIMQGGSCTGDAVCRIYLQPGERSAVVVSDGCAAPGITPEQQTRAGFNGCTINVTAFEFDGTQWANAEMLKPEPSMTPQQEQQSLSAERTAIERGDVKIAPARKRQIFIGGKPVNQPFD